MDPLQFVYRRDRGVDDAKALIIDTMYNSLTLEQLNSLIRLLLADSPQPSTIFNSTSWLLNSLPTITGQQYSLWPPHNLDQVSPKLRAVSSALHLIYGWLQSYTAQLSSGEIRWWHSPPDSAVRPLTWPWSGSAGVCVLVWHLVSEMSAKPKRWWWFTPTSRGTWLQQ